MSKTAFHPPVPTTIFPWPHPNIYLPSHFRLSTLPSPAFFCLLPISKGPSSYTPRPLIVGSSTVAYRAITGHFFPLNKPYIPQGAITCQMILSLVTIVRSKGNFTFQYLESLPHDQRSHSSYHCQKGKRVICGSY